MSEIKGIFLDLDGTLADSLDLLKEVFFRFGDAENIQLTEADFDHFNGPPISDIISGLQNRFAMAQPIDNLVKEYEALVDGIYLEASPTPGAEEFLLSAKSRGCTVGLVTSNTENRVTNWLHATELFSLIDFVVTGNDVLKGKPAPDAYQHALKAANLPAESCIAVEDSAQGLLAARAAGLVAWCLTTARISPPAAADKALLGPFETLARHLWMR